MNDDPAQRQAQDINVEKERTKRTSSASTIAVTTVVFCAWLLVMVPTWPAAFGVMALSGMAMVACFFILHYK